MADATATPTTRSGKDGHLHSKAQTFVPSIVFKDSREHDFPIVKFVCLRPPLACFWIKSWLFGSLREFIQQDPRAVRNENLKLGDIPPKTQGSLLLLEDAAYLDHYSKPRVSILALIMPGDQNIRWFYSVSSVSPLLAQLEKKGHIAGTLTCEPTVNHRVYQKVKCSSSHDAPLLCTQSVNGQKREDVPDYHCRLYIFLSQAFIAAIAIPHHPDYLNAMQLTDYSPEIMDSDTALQRLEADDLSASARDGKDLSDDRYLLELHPAEREIASLVHLHCAEYILMKRKFFFDFYIEMMHTNKDIDRKRQKVRSDRAHQQWLERENEWRHGRAKRCLDGWKVLGLLDERKIFAWIRSGGMLQHAGSWVEDDESSAAGAAHT